MGHLTTITIHNDALGDFQKDPALFAQTIFDGINVANRASKQISMPFGSYCNYLDINPSRHADENLLFLQMGGCVSMINPYYREFDEMLEKNPEFVERPVSLNADLIKAAKKKIKENKAKKNETL